MHESRPEWTLEDEGDVSTQLDKLFALQDKPLGNAKKAVWIEELRNTDIPPKAILRGLEQLKTEELQNLKFATVCAAARKFVVEPAQVETTKCNDCDGRGIIMMRDKDRYEFALACRCNNGAWRGNGLARWNGLETQTSNGRLLEKTR